jgi:predicted helicase
LKLDDEAARERFDLGKDARDWSVAMARKDLTPNPDFSKIVKINYRPFDTRYTYYTGRSKGFHCRSRGNVMRHFIAGNNLGLTTNRQVKSGGFCHVLIHENIVDSSFVSNKTSERSYAFPLYLYPDKDSFDKDEKRRPNLNQPIVQEIADRTGLSFTAEKQNDENTFAPIDLLDYIYAVLYSNNYRTKYREFLKIDFPRVPYPENVEQFYKLVSIGSLLRNLHLMEDVSPIMGMADFPVPGTSEIEKINYKAEKVFINKRQYFENVPQEAWNYYIGGYQPAQKWLKDRRGRVLSFEDIEHYQKIIAVLNMTIELQRQIDEALL